MHNDAITVMTVVRVIRDYLQSISYLHAGFQTAIDEFTFVDENDIIEAQDLVDVNIKINNRYSNSQGKLYQDNSKILPDVALQRL